MNVCLLVSSYTFNNGIVVCVMFSLVTTLRIGVLAEFASSTPVLLSHVDCDLEVRRFRSSESSSCAMT